MDDVHEGDSLVSSGSYSRFELTSAKCGKSNLTWSFAC